MATTLFGMLTRIAFFIASFFPLWGIMIFLAIFEYEIEDYFFVYVGVILVVITCISHVNIQIRNSKRNAENSKEILIKSKKDTTKEYVFSVIPYVLIFTSTDLEFTKLVSLLVVFFIIGVLYVRTNMVLTNPMLLLFGFRVFEITYEEKHNSGYEKTTLLLTKKMPLNGAEITIEEIYDGIHMVSKTS